MEVALGILLASLTGFATAAQGATNAALGSKVGAVQAALVSFAGGLIILSVICLFFGQGDILAFFQVEWWKRLPGVYGAFIVFMIAFCTPRLGAALTLTLLMLGQLIGGITIDTLGLFEATQIDPSPFRIAGCALLLAGIGIVYAGRLRQDKDALGEFGQGNAVSIASTLPFVGLAFAAGLSSAVQTPTNAALAAVTGTIEASTTNFAVGFTVLLIATLITTRGKIAPMKGLAPWKFTGGVYGAFGVPAITVATPILGVGLSLGFLMLAQLIGGLLLDAFGWMNVRRAPVDAMRVAGAIVLTAGVVLVTLGIM